MTTPPWAVKEIIARQFDICQAHDEYSVDIYCRVCGELLPQPLPIVVAKLVENLMRHSYNCYP